MERHLFIKKFAIKEKLRTWNSTDMEMCWPIFRSRGLSSTICPFSGLLLIKPRYTIQVRNFMFTSDSDAKEVAKMSLPTDLVDYILSFLQPNKKAFTPSACLNRVVSNKVWTEIRNWNLLGLHHCLRRLLHWLHSHLQGWESSRRQ